MRITKRYDWLTLMINANSFTIGAEVGAAIGNTTARLLRDCPDLKRLFVVDLWIPVPGSCSFDRTDMEKVFRDKFEHETRVLIIKGISWEKASEVENYSLDFVFIDAAHDYESVTKDISAWSSKVKPGGVVCGHDINLPGVLQSVEEAFGLKYKKAGVDNLWFTIV